MCCRSSGWWVWTSATKRLRTRASLKGSFHESEYQRLRAELQAAHEASRLPEKPDEETRGALNDLLVRVRLGGARE